MRVKQYKPGDRIFYEDYDGDICTGIVKRVKPDYYENTVGKDIKFNRLITDEGDGWEMSIEDYNCLSPRNPKCKELVKKYKTFDKQRDKILDSIMDIMKPFDIEVKKEIIDSLKLKIEK